YKAQKERSERYGKVCGCPYASIGTEIATQDDKIRAKAEELMLRTTKYLESAIADAKREGLVTVENPKTAAKQLHAFILGNILQAKVENNIEALRDLEPTVMAIIGARA